MTARQLVVYGDFNCPWSYLASRRAALLARAGAQVDWRAVEHDPWVPRRFMDSSGRFAELRAEMERVSGHLLPGEELPYCLSGFVPRTTAAISGYAEAHGAGVGDRVRELLFQAFWQGGLDLGDARLVRTLLVDAIRSGSATSDTLHDWGYAVAVTGGPITSGAWRQIEQWRAQWRASGKEVVPVLVVDEEEPRFGVEAVEWLGAELLRTGVDVTQPPAALLPPQRHVDPPDHSWVTQHGSRWLRDFQALHDEPFFPRAG
jgi:2-hydroxychromene-2-carboxylate isomerase